MAVPGLGSLRFGLNSTAVEDVNKVSSSLINRRYIIFVPHSEIREELAKTSVNITCYDRNGKVVKQVTSSDKNDTDDGNGGNSGGGGNSGNTSQSGDNAGGSGSKGTGSEGTDSEGTGSDGGHVNI